MGLTKVWGNGCSFSLIKNSTIKTDCCLQFAITLSRITSIRVSEYNNIMPDNKQQDVIIHGPLSSREFASQEPPTVAYNWQRGVFFNATIVGIAAFTAPGLWNAMQSVGAGGEETPYLVMCVSPTNPLLFARQTS